jgi:hypothetical protein
MKYIMFKGKGEFPLPVIFPDHIDHEDMKIAIEAEFIGYKAVSAGKISFPLEAIDNVFLHGASISLQMKPGLDDEKYIKIFLKMQEL